MSKFNASNDAQYADTLTQPPTPQVFYETYVKQRRPVLLKGCSHHITPKIAHAVSSLDRLQDIVASDTVVQINEQCNAHVNDVFSPKHSKSIDMKFGDFIHQLSTGKYYMTTQTLPTNDEGRPEIYTTPITQLVKSGNMDSLRPPLLGHLVLMTCNLWIGHAATSASSGLHHDYHDNLYCLLEGNKSFRIAPPSCIHSLKMVGTLHTLHDNGRIVYQEQVCDGDEIRPDGALTSVEEIMKLEIRREEIEIQLQTCKDEKVREMLEAELDAIQEELLDLEMDNNDDDTGTDDVDLFGGGNLDEQPDSDDGELDINAPPETKRARLNSIDDKQKEDTAPLNFVTEESSEKPKFQMIEMMKGDLLYLPAGWFHEVSSSGGLHIAFNYWMHPPDVGKDATFGQPYLSQFWQRDWESREESKLSL